METDISWLKDAVVKLDDKLNNLFLTIGGLVVVEVILRIIALQ